MSHTPLPPFDAAKTIGEISAWQLSNLQMQKILYVAQMFYMGQNNGQLLINAFFEAWDYGPVLPVLYHEFKYFGNRPVAEHSLEEYECATDPNQRGFLQETVSTLGRFGASALIAVTHKENGAWRKHYKQGVRGIVIPNEDILEEYTQLIKESENAKESKDAHAR